jgi:hypothetical protein
MSASTPTEFMLVVPTAGFSFDDLGMELKNQLNKIDQ